MSVHDSDVENSELSENNVDDVDIQPKNKPEIKFSNKFEKRYHDLTCKTCKLSDSERSDALIILLDDMTNSKNGHNMDSLRDNIHKSLKTIQNTCKVPSCGLVFNSGKALSNHMILKHNSACNRAIEKLKFDVEYNEMKSGKKSTGDVELNKRVQKLPKKGINKRGPYDNYILCFFVTIKPAQCDVNTLIKIIDFIKSTDYAPELLCYVFEQRADDIKNMGNGSHIHAIVKKTYSACVTKKYLYQAARKINKFFNCIDSLGCIDVVDIRCNEHLNNVINYMKGNKKPEKIPVCAINTAWRNKYKLDHFYNLDEKHVVIPEQVEETTFENSSCLIETCGNSKFCVVVVEGIKYRLPIV